jgi:hypothetical protein
MDYDFLGFAERPIAAVLILAGGATLVASVARYWRRSGVATGG